VVCQFSGVFLYHRKRLIEVPKSTSQEIEENRDLTDEELRLVRWLLENGEPSARRYLDDLDDLRVVSKCTCGCASINFVDESGGMEILGDFKFTHREGGQIGVFAFAVNDRLAGLELWSIDGVNDGDEIPDPDQLDPLHFNRS
jgi:hypothetical protein